MIIRQTLRISQKLQVMEDLNFELGRFGLKLLSNDFDIEN